MYFCVFVHYTHTALGKALLLMLALCLDQSLNDENFSFNEKRQHFF